MYRLSPEMNIILGVLIYDRILGKDNGYHIRGRFYKNPGAMTPEKQTIVYKFTKAFLG